MKSYRLFVIATGLLTLVGCSHAAGGGAPQGEPTHTPSASATTTVPAPSPGWHTYTNTAGAYSLQYPANWHEIPNPNVPNDYPSSFSNENAGYWPRTSPEVGTPANVFLTVERDSTVGTCANPPHVTSSSDTRLGGELAKRYVMAIPPGYGSTDTTYRIMVGAVHRNHCWDAMFDSRTQTARDGNASTDDQIIASFKFLD